MHSKNASNILQLVIKDFTFAPSTETASKARNLFKQMESGEGQENDERATTKPRENRLSKEVSVISFFLYHGTYDSHIASMN